MWCSSCRQDVPVSIAPGGGHFSCPRCGDMMPSPGATPVGRPVDVAEVANSAASTDVDYDEWEMEERLLHLERIYARTPLRSPLTASQSRHFRLDSRHNSIPRERPLVTRELRSGRLARLGVPLLALGLSATACGGCLLAWAHYGARGDLMPMGIPITAAGLVLLLAGLVLQCDSPSPRQKHDPEAGENRSPIGTIGLSQVRFDNESDNAPSLQDLTLRLEQISKKLEGELE